MKLKTKAILGLMTAGLVSLATAPIGMAQDTSKTQVVAGTSTSTTSVEKGEVVYVSGNDLVAKMDTGEIRHFNVPDTARATVDGKELSIHDLKPGMKLQRTITTTTTPKTVTTIRTIQGTVFAVIPPSNLILSFPDGSPNKSYNVPKDQKFVIDGKPYSAFELKKGMKIGATVVTESSDVAVSETRRATGTAPAAAAPPPPPPTPVVYVGVLLIEAPAPATPPPPPPTGLTARPASAEPAPKALPKTASSLPLVGLLGLLLCTASLGVRTIRRYSK
jgi:hypothetical protein